MPCFAKNPIGIKYSRQKRLRMSSAILSGMAQILEDMLDVLSKIGFAFSYRVQKDRNVHFLISQTLGVARAESDQEFPIPLVHACWPALTGTKASNPSEEESCNS